jgi:hypothetical protein
MDAVTLTNSVAELQLPEGYTGTVVESTEVSTLDSTAEGDGLSTAVKVAGNPQTFTIFTKDTLGNRVTVGGAFFSVLVLAEAGGVSFRVAESDVVDNNDGTYTVRYAPTRAGVYRIEITRNVENVGGNTAGYPITVVAGPTVPTKTTIVYANAPANNFADTDLQIAVNQQLELLASTFDNYGNPTVSVVSPSRIQLLVLNGAQLVDLVEFMPSGVDERYFLSYRPTFVTNDLLMRITVDEVLVVTKQGLVSADVPDVATSTISSQTTASGRVSDPVNAGLEHKVTLTLRDADSNVISNLEAVNSDTYRLVLKTGNTQLLESTFSSDLNSIGSLAAVYTYTVAGTYTLQVLLGSGALFLTDTAVVAPTEPAAAQTTLLNFPPAPAWISNLQATFQANMKDQYGNLVTDSTKLSPLVLTLSTTNTAQLTLTYANVNVTFAAATGLHTVTFTPPAPGRLEVTLAFGGVEVRNANRLKYSAIVQTGDANAANSFFAGTSITSGFIANQPITFAIELKDAGGFTYDRVLDPETRLLALVIFKLSSGDRQVAVTLTYMSAGMYIALATKPADINEAGDVTVVFRVTLDGVLVGGAEKTSTMAPTTKVLVLDPSKSLLFYSSTPGVPGGANTMQIPTGTTLSGKVDTALYFFVQLSSLEGIAMSTTPAGTTLGRAHNNEISLNVTALPGRYEIGLSSTQVGSFSVFNLAVNDVPITVPSVTFAVVSFAIDNEKSQLSGPGLNRAVVNFPASFTFTAIDLFGNPVVYDPLVGLLPLTAQIISDNPGTQLVEGIVTPSINPANEYVITYMATSAGFAEIRIRLDGSDIFSTNVLIENGAFDKTKTTYNPPADSALASWGRPTAGRPYPLNIFAFDTFDNPHNTPPLSFMLRMVPDLTLQSKGVTAREFDSVQGTALHEFQLVWTVQTAGVWSLDTSLSSSDLTVPLTEFTITDLEVFGAEPSPQVSTFSGVGVSGGPAASTAVRFVVKYFDKFGNPTPKWGSQSLGFAASKGNDLFRPQVSIARIPFLAFTFSGFVVRLLGGASYDLCICSNEGKLPTHFVELFVWLPKARSDIENCTD